MTEAGLVTWRPHTYTVWHFGPTLDRLVQRPPPHVEAVALHAIPTKEAITAMPHQSSWTSAASTQLLHDRDGPTAFLVKYDGTSVSHQEYIIPNLHRDSRFHISTQPAAFSETIGGHSVALEEDGALLRTFLGTGVATDRVVASGIPRGELHSVICSMTGVLGQVDSDGQLFLWRMD